jgi:hypothetical protein
MSIQSTDIVLRLSGGASNTAALASLGGAKSSTAAPAGIFDDVGGAESSAGDTEYRCVYVHNAHASLTLQNAVAYLASNTPSNDTAAAIGLGTSAVNGTEQTVPDEGTAPAGVTFVAAATQGAGIALGDIPALQHRAVWLRRVVNAGAAAYNGDGFTMNVVGDTAA